MLPIFRHDLGDSDGQQTWEALALLVALRLWRHHWHSQRFRVVIQGDSMTALHVLLDTRAKSEANNIIAREISLELGAWLYRPDEIEHIPGVTNVVPDFLSRCVAEKKDEPWPKQLLNAEGMQRPPRDASGYVSLVPPRLAGRRKRVKKVVG